MYFGALPALLFFIPCKTLLGFYPTDNAVIALVSLATIAILLATCKRVSEKLLGTPRFGHPALWLAYIAAASSLALQLGGAVWVVAAVSALFFQVLALYGLLRAITPDTEKLHRNSLWWAALAGSATVAAVGCRPTHLIVVPVGAMILLGAKLLTTTRKHAALHCAAFALPIGVGCALLGWYNSARFGDVLQFGQRYQLGVTDFTTTPLCSLERALHNPLLVAIQSWYLLLQPFYLTSSYPFLNFNRIEPLELQWHHPDYLGSDPVTGLLFVSPLLVPGLCAAALWLRSNSRVAQLYYGGCLAIAALGLLYLHTCTFAAARFLFEIVSVLLIITLPSLWHACATVSPARLAWRLVTTTGVVIGLCIGVSGSLGGHFAKGPETERFFRNVLGLPKAETTTYRDYKALEIAPSSSGDAQIK